MACKIVQWSDIAYSPHDQKIKTWKLKNID